MLRIVSSVLILMTCGPGFTAAAQDQAPPKELIQYIRDAEKAGQNLNQIQQNAVSSGWATGTVNQAIAYVRDHDGAGATAAAKLPAADLKDTPGQPADGGTPAPATGTGAPAGAPAMGGKPADAAKPAETVKPGDTAKASATVMGTKPEKIDRGVPDDYQFGAGDAMDINVWKEPDASVHGAVIRTDGKISMPLLKEVEVVGLTPTQLEKLITERLVAGGMINSPDVTVIVTGTSSKKIYVQGQVKKEGPIPFTYNMSVMQALSEAGGISPYAKKTRIYILRRENGKTFQLPFDYAAVLKGQRLELNIQLQAGDMIVVP